MKQKLTFLMALLHKADTNGCKITFLSHSVLSDSSDEKVARVNTGTTKRNDGGRRLWGGGG